MKKTILITTAIIVFALIGGGVVWYLKSQKNQLANPPVTENKNQPSENPKSEISNPNLEDWQTYRNEEYGFEVRYHDNIHVTESLYSEKEGTQRDKLYVSFGYFNIRFVEKILGNINLLEWANQKSWAPYSEKNIIKIGDFSCITRYTNFENEYQSIVEIYFIKDNNIFKISWNDMDGTQFIATEDMYFTFVNSVNSLHKL